MKRIVQLMMVAFGAFIFGNVNAQLADGTVCPDWTGTDTNGNSWTLYDVLDSGKPAIIDISATWCGPCWNYHQGGALEEAYEQYGPDGSDELMIFWIEGDGSTNNADLIGTGGNTIGDWTANTNFPIIDDASIGEAMGIPSGNGPYPTVYLVCPNRTITNIGTASAEQIYELANAATCAVATEPVDPALTSFTTTGDGCDGVYSATVEFMNLGTDALTSATVTATGCSNCPVSQDWSGSLSSYEQSNVTVTGIEVTGTQNVEFEITSNGDANIANNFGNTFLLASDHTTHFKVTIQTDRWPGETTWDLKDGSGSTVMSGGPYGDGTGAEQDAELVFEEFSVDGDLGCWEFTINDSYGDGMNASQYGLEDGSTTVETVDTDGNNFTFYSYDGSYEFDADSGRGNVNAVSVEEADALQSSMNVFPNPINADSKLAFTLTSANTVSYQVVDLLGKVVVSENLGTLPAGARSEELNIENLESGIYMIQLTAGTSTASMKLTLAK